MLSKIIAVSINHSDAIDNFEMHPFLFVCDFWMINANYPTHEYYFYIVRLEIPEILVSFLCL